MEAEEQTMAELWYLNDADFYKAWRNLGDKYFRLVLENQPNMLKMTEAEKHHALSNRHFRRRAAKGL